MQRYKSVHTGAQIDSGVARALPGGEIDASLSNKVAIGALSGVDLNAITEDGHYRLNGNCANVPITGGGWEQWTQLIVVHGKDSDSCAQIMPIYHTGDIWSRTRNEIEIWTEWKKLATATPPTIGDLPLTSGFSVSVGFSCKFCKTQDGIVIVYGSISGSVSANSQTLVATLPLGYRPSESFQAPATAYGNSGPVAGYCAISPDGSIAMGYPSDVSHQYILALLVAGN